MVLGRVLQSGFVRATAKGLATAFTPLPLNLCPAPMLLMLPRAPAPPPPPRRPGSPGNSLIGLTAWLSRKLEAGGPISDMVRDLRRAARSPSGLPLMGEGERYWRSVGCGDAVRSGVDAADDELAALRSILPSRSAAKKSSPWPRTTCSVAKSRVRCPSSLGKSHSCRGVGRPELSVLWFQCIGH